MTTENGLIITPVTGGETRSYVTNPNEWMGNVHAETDPVTGGISSLSSGGNAFLPAVKRTAVMVRGLCGKLNSIQDATTFNYTSHHAMVCEADFDAVRIIVPYNYTSNGSAGFKAACAVSNAWVAPSVAGTAPTTMRDPSTGTWVNLTWAGAASTTLLAATSVNQPSYQASDWVELHSIPRTDGGTLPVLMVRLMSATAASHNYYSITNADPSTLMRAWNTESNVQNRAYMSINQATDGVTTPANFTQTNIAMNAQPVIVEYVSRRKGISVLAVGDSITEGAHAVNRAYSHAQIAAYGSSASSKPISVINFGWGGQTSAQYWQRAMDVLDAISPPTMLVYSVWSPNDETTPITAAQISAKMYRLARLLAKCESKGTLLVLLTGTPVNHTGTNSIDYGATSDTLRQGLNTDLLNMAAHGQFLVIDADGAISTGVAYAGGSTQMEMASGTNDDALHPNHAGNSLIAEKYSSVFSAVI